MLADLLAVDPNNADALALDSRLLLAEGRIDDAAARARAALQSESKFNRRTFRPGPDTLWRGGSSNPPGVISWRF